jgi:hypothetical protein
MGEVIPFPRQEKIHWQGRPLTYQELQYTREFLLSVARRVRVKRLRFEGVDFLGNDIKVIVDQLYEKKVIIDEEKEIVYERLTKGFEK